MDINNNVKNIFKEYDSYRKANIIKLIEIISDEACPQDVGLISVGAQHGRCDYNNDNECRECWKESLKDIIVLKKK